MECEKRNNWNTNIEKQLPDFFRNNGEVINDYLEIADGSSHFSLSQIVPKL